MLNLALTNINSMTIRPSLLAAAALYADRRARGWVPAWPSAIAGLTGWSGTLQLEFASAVQVVQKLTADEASPDSVLP